MEFKYPAALYFLFVLIIPILIHLFNLKKFKKIELKSRAKTFSKRKRHDPYKGIAYFKL